MVQKWWIHLYKDQRSFLKKSPRPAAGADKVSSLSVQSWPARSRLNLDSECSGIHRDLEVTRGFTDAYLHQKVRCKSEMHKQKQNILQVHVLCKHCTPFYGSCGIDKLIKKNWIASYKVFTHLFMYNLLDEQYNSTYLPCLLMKFKHFM